MLLAMNGSNLLKATGFTGFGMIIVFMFSLVGKHINSEEVLRLLKMTYRANKRS